MNRILGIVVLFAVGVVIYMANADNGRTRSRGPIVFTSPIEQYIWEKFGPQHGLMALAVSAAENEARDCRAVNVNTNRSRDYGIFQMNSIHLKRFSGYNFSDCYQNIDAAYLLFKAEGWVPWRSSNNERRRMHLARYQRVLNGDARVAQSATPRRATQPLSVTDAKLASFKRPPVATETDSEEEFIKDPVR